MNNEISNEKVFVTILSYVARTKREIEREGREEKAREIALDILKGRE